MSHVDIIECAKVFAMKAHDGLFRPNRAEDPYWTHLEDVAILVAISGGTDEEVAAAWLHDSVEDTSVTLDDIRANFGADVADIVDGMTDPKEFTGMPTLERKTLQAERVKTKSDSVKRVKLADQASNVRSVAEDPPVKWSREKCLDYIEGARRIAEACRGVSNFLDGEFDDSYQLAMRARS